MSLEVQPPEKLSAISNLAVTWRRRFEPWITERSDFLAAVVVIGGLLWRAYVAHATFFNPDEAWHFSAANQDSLRHAYQASLTLFHPPLLVLILYFWRGLGTSDLVLRLPCVIAGTLFCWVYYKWLKSILGKTVAWVGLLLVTFLPTMIDMSAELRQYPLMLLFSVTAAYLLEESFTENSAAKMLLSSACLYLAMLSHYSGFLFAAGIGIYAFVRILAQRPGERVVTAWAAGQLGGLALARFLYKNQIAKLAAVHQAQPLHRIADWYLAKFYYHHGQDHLLPFLIRGTFGVFRFTFSWAVIGYLAVLLFVAGAVLLLRNQAPEAGLPPRHLIAVLLLSPFVVNWAGVAAGLYPYGRTRHCIFLAIFGIAGVSVALVRIAKQRIGTAIAMALATVILCQAFGTPPSFDMFPLADRRHEQMDRTVAFLRRAVSPTDVIYLNKATESQLGHYLCDQRPIVPDRSVSGFESFQCNGLGVVSSFPHDDAVLPETFPDKWKEMAKAYALPSGSKVWVVEGGWTSGFGEMLRGRYPEFSGLEIYSFGRYLEVFSLTVGQPTLGPPKQVEPEY